MAGEAHIHARGRMQCTARTERIAGVEARELVLERGAEPTLWRAAHHGATEQRAVLAPAARENGHSWMLTEVLHAGRLDVEQHGGAGLLRTNV